MQSEKITTESFRLGRFRNLQHAENVAFEVRPAELALSRVIFQVSGTAIAAKDSRKRGSQ
jgi:hypothetical protein